MSTIDWNDGRLLTLTPGQTATCQNLNRQQLYGLFFYNNAQNDAGADLIVNWSNSQPPAAVHVPGTSTDQGLAAIVFVDGSDTSTVSAAMQQGQSGTQLQCFIASVKMPLNMSGISNEPLPIDGMPHSFDKFTRYYAVPPSEWHSLTFESKLRQFIFVQFTERQAEVVALNAMTHPGNTIQTLGMAQSEVKITTIKNQRYSTMVQGNGQQIVWMNADSVQNSKDAMISMQSLSQLTSVYEQATMAGQR